MLPPTSTRQLGDMIRALSNLDTDQATERNGVGFNGRDSRFGNDLARVPFERWSLRQKQAAHRMLRTYRGQLAGLGFDYDAVPEPTEATEIRRPAPPIPATAGAGSGLIARKPGQCARCSGPIVVGELFAWGRAPGERLGSTCSATPGDAVAEAVRQTIDDRAISTPPYRTPASVPATAGAAPGLDVYQSDLILGPGGVIAQKLPGYEHRESQLDAARLIERAIASSSHAVIEAGTGTGKSLAYLVPAIMSGKRTIVSTADKTLQEQIAGKDIPFLQSVMPRPFRAAVLKGRSNYVCNREVKRIRDEAGDTGSDLFGGDSAAFDSAEAAQLWPAFVEWIGSDEVGDLESAPVDFSRLRPMVTIDSESCLGQSCPLFSACYAEKAKHKAEDADVVIVNHALFLRDRAVRDASEGMAHILPDAAVAILDEAHHLEDVATDSFATEVTWSRWSRIAATFRRLTIGHKVVKEGGDDSEHLERAEQWDQELTAFGAEIDGILGVWRDRLIRSEATVQVLGDETALVSGPMQALDLFAVRAEEVAPAWLVGDEREAWKKLARSAGKFAASILDAATPLDNLVRYVEIEQLKRGGDRLVCHVKPIEVDDILRRLVWEAFPTVIATSATMATGTDFSYWRGRVGLEDASELIVASPFDYGRQAMLYLPQIGSDYDPTRYRREGTIEYYDRLAGEIERLILASDGRAFVLFTSNRVLREVYNRLAPRLAKYLVLRQGDASAPELIRRFKASGSAILFGVKRFWEGVDVQGEALSMVIVDKLPFTPPDDPIWDARCQAINRREGDRWAWFERMGIPVATIALKQAFGRLIRTRGDRGVVAMLDGRLTTKPYGARIVDALPPATRTRSLDAVRAFYGLNG